MRDALKTINHIIKSFGDFAFRFRYAAGALILATALCLSLHMSSIGSWDYFHPGGPETKNINIIGYERHIRSDEWISHSVIMLAQAKSDKFYPLINESINGGTNMFLMNQPVFDVSLVGRPHFWGFILFGVERGFSWFWFFRLLLLFFTSFELFRYLTKDRRGYSLAGALLITFSPLVQWWFGEIFIDLFMYFQLSLVCLITYFKVHDSALKRILCICGLAIGLCSYGFSFFPAVQFPLFLVMLAFIGYILFENRTKIRKFDIIMAGSCIAFVGAIIAITFARSWDDLITTMGMSQANRFMDSGSYTINHPLHEYLTFMLPFKDLGFTNPCEASRFLTFFPVLIPIFPFLYSRMGRKKPLFLFLYAAIIICYIWAMVPLPKLVSKLLSQFTLLFATNRIQIILGLLCTYLLISILPVLEKYSKNIFKKTLFSILVCAVICYATYAQPFRAYLAESAAITTAAFIIMSLLLIWGKPKLFSVVTVGCLLYFCAFVNPIARGLDPIYGKPVASEIMAIKERDPGAKWLINTGIHHTFLPAFGVNCFNTVQMTPNLEQWEKLDPNKEYRNAYNKYAFVRLEFSEEETSFTAPSGDITILHLNLKDLRKTEAKYVYTDMELETLNTEEIKFTKLYADQYAPVFIYRIDAPYVASLN